MHIRLSGRDTDELAIDNTLEFCEDLDVNLGDVVLLAVTYQLKSPGVGAFPKDSWVEGRKRLHCDSFPRGRLNWLN